MQPPDTVLHVWPRFDLQAPLPSQVPAQLSVSSAFLTSTQLPPGAEHVLQVPLQSLLLQHALLAMHMLLQGLKPVAQPDAWQVLDEVSHCRAVPFCAGQSLSEQQPLLATHFAPHFFMPPQVKSHFVPSQVAVAPEGTGHGSHEAPQLAVDELETQLPRHACVCPEHIIATPPVPLLAAPPVPDDAPPVPAGLPPEPDEEPPVLVAPPVPGLAPPVPALTPPEPELEAPPPSGPLIVPPEPPAGADPPEPEFALGPSEPWPPEPTTFPPEPASVLLAPATDPPEPPTCPPEPPARAPPLPLPSRWPSAEASSSRLVSRGSRHPAITSNTVQSSTRRIRRLVETARPKTGPIRSSNV